jgi:hypothetical protein
MLVFLATSTTFSKPSKMLLPKQFTGDKTAFNLLQICAGMACPR